jgi:D-glycero-alpha-D-manno-heptose-7-phosphate kinase
MGIKVSSRAPTRIDLAGGTIDLWPLYLFVERPLTINLGIDLWAEAELEDSDDAGPILLRSGDQGAELEVSWNDVREGRAVPPALELHYKLLRHFVLKHSPKPCRLTLSTRAKSPAGAGLGGSSTVAVAIVGALSTWAGDRGSFAKTGSASLSVAEQGERLIDVVRDVETTVIKVPAGVQDYYGAMFGGLQCLRWGVGAHEREWLPEPILAGLEKRLLLFYSGQSRNSGINNWALYKGYIDGAPEVREKFAAIAAATLRLETALRAKDWAGVGDAIDAEWAARRTLGPGISTPEIDRAFAHARELAPVSGKICGAGGGGCVFVYLPDGSDTVAAAQVRKAFVAEGMRELPFKAVPRGLEVRVARA